MAAYEVLLLNTAVPQIQAAQSGDTYVVPRDIAFSTVANLANGTNLLPSLTFSSDTNTGIYREGADALGFTAGGGTNQMVLTTTGLGIGTSSPAAKLDVRGSNSNNLSDLTAQLVNSVDTTAYAQNNGGGISFGYVFNSGGSVIDRAAAIKAVKENSTNGNYATSLVFANAANSANTIEKMRLDSSGNLGLGVTPSAWGSGWKALQIGSGGPSIWTDAGRAFYSSNVYFDGTNRKYVTTNPAVELAMDGGAMAFKIAASGTAGNAISFTQAMTLDASGNLLVGTTTAVSKITSSAGAADGFIGYAGSFHANQGAGGDSSIQLGGNRSAGLASDAVSIINAKNAFGNGQLCLYTEGTERARITSGGNFQTSSGGSVQVGGTAARATTAGTNRLDIFDGTAPVGTLANGVSFYSTAGEARVMDAAGNATLLSPHDTETNEWIFHSKHTPTGKVLRIDVERLLKFVNDHFGLDAVQEFIEE